MEPVINHEIKKTPSTRKLIYGALKTIGARGLDGIKVTAPTLLIAFDLIEAFEAAVTGQRRQRVINELRRQRLIDIHRDNESLHITLSVSGIHRLQRLEIENLIIPQPNHWDRRWRIVFFDVPLRHSKRRQLFCLELRRLGFVMIQRSTWVHPYPCLDIIDQMIRYFQLQRYVSSAEINYFDTITTERIKRAFSKPAHRA